MSLVGRETLVAPDDTWSLLMVMCVAVAVSIYLEQKYMWASKISGAIIALLFALVLSNLSIIPTACTLYDDIIWGFAVPMGIPLLMLQCNMKKIWKETGRIMIIFCIGSAGTVAGAFLAYALLHNFIPGLAGVAAIMTGSYIGGGVNFAALATEFNVGEIKAAATVADNLLMALYFFALIFIAGMKFFQKHYAHPHIDAVKVSDLKDAQTQATIKALTKGIDDALTELTKNNDALTVGANALIAAGTGTGTTEEDMSLTQGADAVEAGIQKLQTTLQTYLGEKLDGGMLNTLKEGVDKLVDGIQQLQAGYDKVDEGTSSLLAGTNTLTASNKQLTSGATALESSGKTLTSGASKLTSASKQLNSGTSKITSATSQLTSGANTLSANSSKLNSGASQLASGTQQLMSGTSTLSSGSAQVKSGIKSLADGAKKLSDGTKEFDEEGIQKLSDLVDDDLQDILDRLDAICSDDNAYHSFSGKEDDMSGNVKFVIETAAIDDDSDK